jgi:hypothetical protein
LTVQFTDDEDFRLLPRRAARFIRHYPVFPRRGRYAPEHRISVLDVLLHCARRRGEAFVAFQILRRHGLPGEYHLNLDVVNDALEVLDRFELTEQECVLTFGPNWRRIIDHACEVSDVLYHDFGTLVRTEGLVGSPWCLTAWITARDTAWDAGRIKSWYRAQEAVWEREYMNDATVHADERRCADIAAAVRDAAAAIALADLVGTGDFTRAEYDALQEPWRRALAGIEAVRSAAGEGLGSSGTRLERFCAITTDSGTRPDGDGPSPHSNAAH